MAQGEGVIMGDETTTPEIWRNESRGAVGIIRLEPNGDTKVELVQPGRQVTLTEAERRLTHAKVIDVANDPFRNGRLYAVQIAEDAEDIQAIRSDPNVISEAEIHKLFDGRLAVLEEKLAKITSPTALHRILAVADEEGASTRRKQAVQDRLTALTTPAVGPVMSGSTPSGQTRDPWYPPEQGGVPPEGGAKAKVG